MEREPDEQEEVGEEGKEQEARGEVAEEPYSPGEGPENLPNPTDHCRVPQERPESLGSPGSTPSDQKEEAGNALLEPQPEESSGETTVGAPQVEGPTERRAKAPESRHHQRGAPCCGHGARASGVERGTKHRSLSTLLSDP